MTALGTPAYRNGGLATEFDPLPREPFGRIPTGISRTSGGWGARIAPTGAFDNGGKEVAEALEGGAAPVERQARWRQIFFP